MSDSPKPRFVSHLRGLGSGREYPAGELMHLDPRDGRPVEIVIDLERLAARKPGAAWYQPQRKSMWRFGELLGFDFDDPAERASIVSGGEGATPLFDLKHSVTQRIGARLQLKDEGHPAPGHGANPTGSFKDRGMSMVATMARRHGLDKLVVPTQGNAGDALAEYALRAGLGAAVIMPPDTPMPVLGRVAALARSHDRIRLKLVPGTIRECGEHMKKYYLKRGYFNVATFQEPGWRIEGKKTLGLELAEPLDGHDWSLPDVIVYPTGGGTGLLGMWKAFDELETLGLIDARRPRMIAVQSEATAPLVEAFARGDEDVTPARQPGATIATGLNVPGGVGHFRVLQILRASGGAALAVSEEQIAAELSAAWRERRLWLSPEGAATLAALEPLAEMGLIARGQRIVCVNTASLEKYLPAVRHLL